jgi:hypothetical protein
MLAARGYMSIGRGLPTSSNELNVLVALARVNPRANLGAALPRWTDRKLAKEIAMNPANVDDRVPACAFACAPTKVALRASRPSRGATLS